MRHGKVLGDGGTSASTEPAGRTSDEARCAVSNTEGWWQPDALPGLLPLPKMMGGEGENRAGDEGLAELGDGGAVLE